MMVLVLADAGLVGWWGVRQTETAATATLEGGAAGFQMASSSPDDLCDIGAHKSEMRFRRED